MRQKKAVSSEAKTKSQRIEELEGGIDALEARLVGMIGDLQAIINDLKSNTGLADVYHDLESVLQRDTARCRGNFDGKPIRFCGAVRKEEEVRRYWANQRPESAGQLEGCLGNCSSTNTTACHAG